MGAIGKILSYYSEKRLKVVDLFFSESKRGDVKIFHTVRFELLVERFAYPDLFFTTCHVRFTMHYTCYYRNKRSLVSARTAQKQYEHTESVHNSTYSVSEAVPELLNTLCYFSCHMT